MSSGIILPVAKSLFLCDGHLGFSGQKADLMGIFDSITADHYPFVQKQFVVFARLAQGLGTIPFWIDIRFAAANQFIASSHINQLVFPNRDVIVHMAMTMTGVQFPKPGIYLVESMLDNQWVTDTTLQLK